MRLIWAITYLTFREIVDKKFLRKNQRFYVWSEASSVIDRRVMKFKHHFFFSCIRRISQHHPSIHDFIFDIQQAAPRFANRFLSFMFISIFMQVEAFPEPIRYWEKIPDNRLIEQSEYDSKYNIETVHSDMWVQQSSFALQFPWTTLDVIFVCHKKPELLVLSRTWNLISFLISLLLCTSLAWFHDGN